MQSGQAISSDTPSGRITIIMPSEKLVVEKAASYAQELIKEIKNGEKDSVYIALILAILTDFFLLPAAMVSIGGITVIFFPVAIIITFVIGIIKIFSMIVCFAILWGAGSFLRIKLRILFFIFALLDLIAIGAFIPLNTLATIWAIHKLRKKARADRELLAQQ